MSLGFNVVYLVEQLWYEHLGYGLSWSCETVLLWMMNVASLLELFQFQEDIDTIHCTLDHHVVTKHSSIHGRKVILCVCVKEVEDFKMCVGAVKGKCLFLRNNLTLLFF